MPDASANGSQVALGDSPAALALEFLATIVAPGVSLGTWCKSNIKPREGRHGIFQGFAQH